MQAHEPIIAQKTIEGHSVRAMYLLTAVADLIRLGHDHDGSYEIALKRLWDNMISQKMYLTGGIGAQKQWEGFGIDYFLPSGTDEGGCYAETCAAIGVMMLAERLLQVQCQNPQSGSLLTTYRLILTEGTATLWSSAYIMQ